MALAPDSARSSLLWQAAASRGAGGWQQQRNGWVFFGGEGRLHPLKPGWGNLHKAEPGLLEHSLARRHRGGACRRVLKQGLEHGVRLGALFQPLAHLPPPPQSALNSHLLANACDGTTYVSAAEPEPVLQGTRLCLPGGRSQARFSPSFLPRFTVSVAGCRIPSSLQQSRTSLELVREEGRGGGEAGASAQDAWECAGLLWGLLGGCVCEVYFNRLAVVEE